MSQTTSSPGTASPVRSRLHVLEAEAVHIIRESAAQFERPVLLFSGGKDSLVLLHLARKAYWPGPLTLPLLHIDTGHNFPETLAFRDDLAANGCALVVRSVEDSIRSGRAVEETGPDASRNALQAVTLRDALSELRIDAALSGARRDEEKARAKERVFSLRDSFGRWDPRRQRPELWRLYNGSHRPGEHFRVFPLSDWTELDVWSYIAAEGIALPSLYYAHERQVVARDGLLLAHSAWITLRDGESWERLRVRFRTVGDATCTSAIPSDAADAAAVLAELLACGTSERATRIDDLRGESAMEDRKRQGYF
jgi:sulfate adenylyltransferase subunit 2